jgi:ribosome maturation factor RimP
LTRVVASEGIEYVHAELRGTGPGAKLRVTIDRPEGVTHEDCALVSRQIDTILDVEELIERALV